ncbi:hypothetical protein [Paraburkholderia tuberum]|uniref:Uncharacterized protein n=1 Tax=Paraburkholderia tuberum TaxID=157910 RepID=A0A1H1JTB8_9BURK|nr:hypothetical protein [Paraburkholderia tuberum]SDR52757.1 hypothetical protein SAMN05445850_5538 [Paraburkholderia tuberum]
MRELFEGAAFKAGEQAARAGVPFHENPLTGPLQRFARQWERSWSEFVEKCSDAIGNTRGGEPV